MKSTIARHSFIITLAATLSLLLILPVAPMSASDEDTAEDLARIKKTANEVLELISEASGLPIKHEINIDIVNKAQVRELMLEMMEKDYPDQILERQFEAYSFLGLVPAGVDIRITLADLITEQAGAFYNPENDTFYAISDLDPMFQNPMVEKTIIAHELTHGLQDQSIDLFAKTKEYAEDPDRLYAMMSVMEGMATVVMTVAIMPSANLRSLPDLGVQTRAQMEMMGSMPEMKVFANAPQYLRETLVSPYAEGSTFVQNFLKQNPEAKIGDVIQNLPISAEQILHYDKYSAGDMPSKAPLDAVLPAMEGDGWDILYSGPLGEFDLRVLMQIHEVETSIEVAKGWDAFTFAALKKNGERFLIGSSVWDSTEDAAEFSAAFGAVLKNVWGENRFAVTHNDKVVAFVASDSASGVSIDAINAIMGAVEYVE